MEIAELIKGWPCIVKGSIRQEVRTISTHSQQIQGQTIFCALKGEFHDGHQYIEEAIKNGAVCIVVEDEQIFDSLQLKQPVIWVPNCAKFVAYASSALTGFASEAIKVVAITGTNGKTTTAHFIYQLLDGLNKKIINIGTNGVRMNGGAIQMETDSLTTLQPTQFHQLVEQAVHSQYDVIVTEASSQGLAQFRLDYTDIDIGVFLNIGEDHIEWHGSVEQYKRAKGRLAELCQRLIINERDALCRSIGYMSKKPTIFFGQQLKSNVYFEKISLHSHQEYCLQYKDQCAVVTFPFKAAYLIENAMAAISVCLQLGYSLQQLKPMIEKLQLPAGRYQQFTYRDSVNVIIDYAHTPDSLKAFLQSLRLQRRKVSIVFSCGGDRDQAKREKMGKIASSYCRKIYLTTDNCRSEDPKKINNQIKSGFFENQVYEVILDRKEAILRALDQSEDGETIVIVGKGHEREQIIGDKRYDYSDIEFVQTIEGIVEGISSNLK